MVAIHNDQSPMTLELLSQPDNRRVSFSAAQSNNRRVSFSNTRRVSFSEALVSSTVHVPYVDQDQIGDLFYTEAEIQGFKANLFTQRRVWFNLKRQEICNVYPPLPEEDKCNLYYSSQDVSRFEKTFAQLVAVTLSRFESAEGKRDDFNSEDNDYDIIIDLSSSVAWRVLQHGKLHEKYLSSSAKRNSSRTLTASASVQSTSSTSNSTSATTRITTITTTSHTTMHHSKNSSIEKKNYNRKSCPNLVDLKSRAAAA